MELLSVIRRWHYRDHFSIREISRRTGLSRNTVRKYLRSDTVEPKFNIPAMLCVLNFASLVPEADFLLLSAMMKNTEEIAGWVKEMTGRACLHLSLPWKPTRQLRGCVVYSQETVAKLEAGLRKAQVAAKTRAPSTKDKAALASVPLAFFGLKQTWSTKQTIDYSLVSLLAEEVQLSASAQYWGLTPNAGVVATMIGAAAAASGIKTLIFFQTIPNAVATKNRFVDELGKSEITLTKDEKSWFDCTTSCSEISTAVRFAGAYERR